MNFVETEYAIKIFSNLDRYKLVRYSPLKLNARCPLCGDSNKNKFKARFWCTSKNSDLMVGCFNCGYTNYFIPFLKEFYPQEFKNFILESRKENNQSKRTTSSHVVKTIKEEPKKIQQDELDIDNEVFSYCERLDILPDNHPIICYIKNRKIPKDTWHLLYFTSDWQTITNIFNPGTYKEPKKEFRLVIPIRDLNNSLTAIQGRSLDKNNTIRYMTLKRNDNSNKIFGLERVDITKPVYIFEGPLDSLFIDNSIALTGGSLDFNLIPIQKDKRVFIWDNEPRNPDTCKRIKTAIDANEKIVLFDKLNVHNKDINDMILYDNITSENLLEYFRKNTINGLQAKMRFANWIKSKI